MRATALATRPATRLHAPDTADSWANCTAASLEIVKRLYATTKRCKVCNQTIGNWVDYCALCVQEDETDCW